MILLCFCVGCQYDVTGLYWSVIGRYSPVLVCDWPKFATHKLRPMRDQGASLAAWPTTITHRLTQNLPNHILKEKPYKRANKL